MNTTSLVSTLAAFAVLAAAGCAVNQDARATSCPCNATAATCPANQGVATTISRATADALRAAWLDERRAQAFYGAVIERHGQVRPFANIIGAEKRHEQAVANLMRKYNVSEPGEGSADTPPAPATIQECAKLAAQVERDNVAMYGRLLKDVTEADVGAVMENLRAASLRNHLPAFEHVAGRAGVTP